MTDKLLDYQLNHVENLVYSLTTYNRALDASDTGTGKTYSSVAVCKTFGWKPLIICPKSVISSWTSVLKLMNCNYYGIANYEMIQNCNYINSLGNKTPASFIKRRLKKKSDIKADDSDNELNEPNPYTYEWIETQIPDDMLVIFDEAHKCKNISTCNGQILANLSSISKVKILILSATVVDKPKYFILIGYVLGLYKEYKEGRHWIKTVGKDFDNPMSGVHKKIYPEYASRMKITNLKDVFPSNTINAETFEMDNAIEIQAQYEIINQVIQDLKNKEKSSGALAKLIYARQRIEMLKIPTFIKLTKLHLAESKSVVLFVNFTETLKTLSEKLNTQCVIYGEQTLEERDNNIKQFNNDNSRICICNIRSGGVGISLHDTKGKYPRVSIISPTWSAQDLLQVLGRVFRAKTLSKVQQRIIFCSGTVEDMICSTIKSKISNIAMLNDGDMSSYQIIGLTNNTNLDDTSKILSTTDSSTFENMFNKLSKLYEKVNMLNKELETVKKEILNTEQIIQSQLN
jgi:superfamily II DNA or RNA helicase